MGKRQSLKHMTPEQRADHIRAQTTARQIAKRKRKKLLSIAVMTSELQEFVDELAGKPLHIGSMAMALWERENKQRFPDLEKPVWTTGMGQSEFSALCARFRRFRLMRLFACEAIERLQARERKAVFRARELEEANQRGVDLKTYQNWKRANRKTNARIKQAAARTQAV